MDIDEAPLSDADAEADEFTTAEWIADVEKYYQDDRPAERQPHEFTITDWYGLMGERRGPKYNRNQAARELEKMWKNGNVYRRWAFFDGKWGWLYSFRKQ